MATSIIASLNTVCVKGRGTSGPTSNVGGTIEETAEEIRGRGGKAIPVPCDHAKEDDVKKVFDKIEKENGKLDVLVNNAYSAVNVSIPTEPLRLHTETSGYSLSITNYIAFG